MRGGNSTADVIAQQSAVDKFLFHLLQTMILNVIWQLSETGGLMNHHGVMLFEPLFPYLICFVGLCLWSESGLVHRHASRGPVLQRLLCGHRKAVPGG